MRRKLNHSIDLSLELVAEVRQLFLHQHQGLGHRRRCAGRHQGHFLLLRARRRGSMVAAATTFVVVGSSFALALASFAAFASLATVGVGIVAGLRWWRRRHENSHEAHQACVTDNAWRLERKKKQKKTSNYHMEVPYYVDRQSNGLGNSLCYILLVSPAMLVPRCSHAASCDERPLLLLFLLPFPPPPPPPAKSAGNVRASSRRTCSESGIKIKKNKKERASM